MKKITGARVVIEALIQEGVKIIFGYPGGAVLPIYDELFKQKKYDIFWLGTSKLQFMQLRVMQGPQVKLELC